METSARRLEIRSNCERCTFLKILLYFAFFSCYQGCGKAISRFVTFRLAVLIDAVGKAITLVFVSFVDGAARAAMFTRCSLTWTLMETVKVSVVSVGRKSHLFLVPQAPPAKRDRQPRSGDENGSSEKARATPRFFY